ncbi:Kv channel-interacting protein 2-like [Venturia canescens]|uniref:Kv channel-interacting protein 2-like n=1 Tax=Venturia canescens TaxID=32260 RepID=UPI001C9C4B12|nr:Kv channel-interacting protein 2-like [Venturia canescens]XP_043267814.1 Kv channel-interacting protein 2-like [Venturia canescens]XP_043267815.1 Kv channel-interacting protein 2-like [Venturia canescens]XP_043267816.1 Kv channel-interacting protein 2-like [Venturia canescens]
MRRSITRVKKTIQRMAADDPHTESAPRSPRIIPERLSSLSNRTGFSNEELRRLYREFKQHCPGGGARCGDLKPAYSKLFPLGDSTKYAQIVFNMFDRDKDGIISFSDLITGLACIVKGDTDQKLSWIFGLYDIDGDGCITRKEMIVIVSSIYEMIEDSRSMKSAVNDHVERLFAKMDLNRDGVISKDEFFTSCKNDRIICDQLNIFDHCFWW